MKNPKLQLYMINISGLMIGDAWGGSSVTNEFSQDFLTPPHTDTPFAINWEGIREALLFAMIWSDVIGDMGEIFSNSATISFHYAGPGVKLIKTRTLVPTLNTKDFFAKGV